VSEKSGFSVEYFLENGLSQMGISVPVGAIDRLSVYFAELKKWNRAINLVAKASDQHILETHFLDSLTLLPLLKEWNLPGPILDIGSGAGFPGLALKAAQPELQVTLLEPRGKRVSFLKNVIRTLGLDNIQALPARLEPEGTLQYSSEIPNGNPTQLPPHPVITSRAFTQVSPFLELVAPVCPPNGKVICMKGRINENEIKTENPAKWQLLEERSFTLPYSDVPRNLLIFLSHNNAP